MVDVHINVMSKKTVIENHFPHVKTNQGLTKINHENKSAISEI